MSETTSTSRLWRYLGFSFAAFLSAASCQSERHEPTGGETHFLTRCDPSAEACGSALSCLCGVCTLACDEQASCRAFSAAECVAATDSAGCPSAQSSGHCDVRCTSDTDCTKLSSSHRCEQGVCRAGPPVSSSGGSGGSAGSGGGGGGGGGGDGGASAGTGGASACAGGDVSANEVLVIGDAFFASSHQITAYLEDLARNAGALEVGQRYRDNSRTTANSLALAGNGIADQYASGTAEGSVKVVVMNGGGADVLIGSCDTLDASCPVLANAASAAGSVLSRMASDGVLHVVYAFYPDPLDAALRQEVDALRPLIQGACESSPVPCHWLDLRTAFAGHAEYVQADGINPTAAGSQASAAAIWALMQEHCIAQ